MIVERVLDRDLGKMEEVRESKRKHRNRERG